MKPNRFLLQKEMLFGKFRARKELNLRESSETQIKVDSAIMFYEIWGVRKGREVWKSSP